MPAVGLYGLLRPGRQGAGQKVEVHAKDLHADGHKQEEGLREDTFARNR